MILLNTQNLLELEKEGRDVKILERIAQLQIYRVLRSLVLQSSIVGDLMIKDQLKSTGGQYQLSVLNFTHAVLVRENPRFYYGQHFWQ